jgi:hypothetical protein
MKFNQIIAILLCCMSSVFCHASQLVSIGNYSLSGTIQDGARDKPGLIVPGVSGKFYRGLALDEPLNISHITVGVDTSSWPVLESGQLDHIQMVMDYPNATEYKKLYGKHVVVECFIDFVGRYYTPVFCGVSKITLAPISVSTSTAAIRTAPLSKKNPVNSQKTKALFDTLSYCVAPTAQYGQYSSYDGGKSFGILLMDKCNKEFLAWKQSCMGDGRTEDSCVTEGFVYVQSILKKFNK